MNSKDYNLIAQTFIDMLTCIPNSIEQSEQDHYDAQRKGIRMTAISLAYRLKGQNSNFDKDLFLKACGL